MDMVDMEMVDMEMMDMVDRRNVTQRNLSHSWIRWTTGHGHSGPRKQSIARVHYWVRHAKCAWSSFFLQLVDVKVLARLRGTPLITTSCDIAQPNILPHLTLGRHPTVVVVKLCLEFAATNAQQVRAMVKHLAGMIGGTPLHLYHINFGGWSFSLEKGQLNCKIQIL